ncbi:MAG TPA: beta-galactosidase [Clostridiales bacterium]|nr:beta-galactosidase [Clostridiales bacterium]
MTIPRAEYPRPQFKRNEWLNLNGIWEFSINSLENGITEGYLENASLNSEITVPFCPESKLSGIEHTDFMDCVWYKRSFILPDGWLKEGRRTHINIGACDYLTYIYVNSKQAGLHRGGYTSFSFDITSFVNEGENIIAICAEDNFRSGKQPSGKQSPQKESFGCFYTRTTGIWQTVWLENTPDAYIASIKMTPDIHTQELLIEAECINASGKTLSATALFEGKETGNAVCIVYGDSARITLKLSELHLWSLESPLLYDLKLKLDNDEVTSYFGMRNVYYSDHCFYLNDKPIFQRLVLDQGFYPDGIYTAPTDEDLKNDILLSKAMGFNGARLHQKIFEERFLYYCDILGYMVWEEHANWGLQNGNDYAQKAFLPEWLEALKRDYNHPAIIGWCPFNETDNVPDGSALSDAYKLTKAFDRTRPVIDTSGWTRTEKTDMEDAHDYDQNPKSFKARYESLREDKTVNYGLVPWMPTLPPELCFISEYGGIWWNPNDESGWGYGERVKNTEEFIERYKGLTEAILENSKFCAFCYTQLTDVEQEQNGLYTYNRVPKFNVEIIRKINTMKAAIEE